MKAQQSFNDDKLARLHVLGSNQRAGAVVIHRLQDRLTVTCALQVLLQNVDIVAIRDAEV